MWCIRQLWCSSIILCNITSIAYNHYTNLLSNIHIIYIFTIYTHAGTGVGIDLGQEEEEEDSSDDGDIQSTTIKDSGGGVFPVSTGAGSGAEGDSHYDTLPPIMDGDEEAEDLAKRQKE